MQALGIKQFHLVGSSMGGFIGAYCAATYPGSGADAGAVRCCRGRFAIKTHFMQQLYAGNNLMLPKDRDDFAG